MAITFAAALPARAATVPDVLLPQPGATYKFVFDLDAAKPTAAGTESGLEEVLKFHKIYEDYGVPDANLKFVVVIHNDKAGIAVTSQAYSAKHAGAANPNIALLARLSHAGIRCIVAGPALSQAGYDAKDVLPGVEVGPLANVAFLNLEAEGYIYTGTRNLNED